MIVYNHLCNYLTSSISHIFHKTLLLLKNSDWQTMITPSWILGRIFFFNVNNMCSSVPENHCKYLYNDRTEGFKQNKFEIFYLPPWAWQLPQFLNTLLMISAVILTNMILGGANYIKKCVNITLWIDIIFQGTNAIYYKITHGKNTHQFNL